MSNNYKYRLNVACVVLNEDGLVLACQRNDEHRSWQFPQGGIDEGEDPESAMRRELYEEIGVSEIEIIGALDKPIRYDWPMKYAPIPGFCGQEQFYFLVRVSTDANIDLCAHEPHEFQDYKWLSIEDFFKLEIGFKKDAYKTALGILLEKFPNIIVEK